MDEMKTVFLSDGKKIVLDDDNDLILSLVSNKKTEDTYKLPYPSGGYGGRSLRLSPSEKYLVFSCFSGESEEAFSLFEIENARLKLLYDSGYLYGEDARYSFVDDEKILVQTFRTGSWYKENAETDENKGMYYEFGELNLFSLETHELSRHTIRVYPSDDWKEEETDVGSFMFSGIISTKSGCQFSVIVPWGKITFSEPLENILVVRPE
ncbi:MAG: hypothetical protein K2N56_04845 [Oscillospiraceae bacterium]|nr:hypothetical protein [Oscillospiraceae bacterium]